MKDSMPDIVAKLLDIMGDEFSAFLFLQNSAWEEEHIFDFEEVAQAAHEFYETHIRHNAENRRFIAQYLLDFAKSGDDPVFSQLIVEDLSDNGIEMETASDQENIAGIEHIIAPRRWIRGTGYVIEN